MSVRGLAAVHAARPRDIEGTPDEQAPTFGNRLKQLRVAAGLSQGALAERAGLSANALSALECGARRAPQRATLAALVSALDLSDAEQAGLELIIRRERGPRGTVGAHKEETATLPRLPVPPTPLLAREDEIACARGLLRSGLVRLLTLTGPGGVGKTRVALAVARSVENDFPVGVRFVDLAPCDDRSAARAAIMTALPPIRGMRQTPHDALDDNDRGLVAKRRVLLVLDNCEHLLPDLAHEVAVLLEARGEVAILATSREPLRLRWEHRLSVRPLALPALQEAASVDVLLSSPAVALFVARARAARPDFTLTPENGPAVAALCLRLDGLPLAIELAAARADLLSPAALLDRIDRRLPLPPRGVEDAPARHYSLQAAIEWSYGQLVPAQQALLQRLAGLPGCWTLGEAEAEADAGPEIDVFAAVIELVDKGLLVAVPRGDEAHFAVLQTVRAHVAQRRTSPDEAGDNPLSARERAVLRLVADGLPSKQIGRKLGLAERTVKQHVTGAMNKLGAFSRAQALAIALRHAYV